MFFKKSFEKLYYSPDKIKHCIPVFLPYKYSNEPEVVVSATFICSEVVGIVVASGVVLFPE